MVFVVDKLIEYSAGKDEELRDISGLGMLQLGHPWVSFIYNYTALKTITAELPVEGKIAAKACEKLTPKLLTQLSNVRSLNIIVSIFERTLHTVQYTT